MNLFRSSNRDFNGIVTTNFSLNQFSQIRELAFHAVLLCSRAIVHFIYTDLYEGVCCRCMPRFVCHTSQRRNLLLIKSLSFMLKSDQLGATGLNR